MTTVYCAPSAYQDNDRICAILFTRMETLLLRQHVRVVHLEELSRETANRCAQDFHRRGSWLAHFGIVPRIVVDKCIGDMAASVSMALSVMQMKLLDRLFKGEGIEHPLSSLLLERFDRDHDDIMKHMRLFVYGHVAMVQEGMSHHLQTHNVRVSRNDIERWIERHSRIADGSIPTE